MLLNFTLSGRTLVLNNPATPDREQQISYIQCQIELKSKVFTARDTLIALFKSASYNIKEEVLLDISYNVVDNEIVDITCYGYVPGRVFERGGVIQMLIYKKNSPRNNGAHESTNTIEFYIDPRKYVPLKTSDLCQQLIDDITDVKDTLSHGIRYDSLIDKPAIEGITLIGNKYYEELNLLRLTNTELEALLS